MMKKEDIMKHAIEVSRHTSKIEERPYSAFFKDFQFSKDTYSQFVKDEKVPTPVNIRFYITNHENENEREPYEVGIIKGFTEDCVEIVDISEPDESDDLDMHDIDNWIDDILTISLDRIYMLGFEY